MDLQERVLAWWRVRAEAKQPKRPARAGPNSGKFSPEAAAFWGLGG